MDLIKPEFRISANEKDITAAIASRLVSLRVTDELGFQSDTLEIRLSDHDPAQPIQKPPKGAELEVWLGYDGDVQRMGMYVADEIERGGWPRYMVIRGRAAAYEETPKGKTDMQSQKVRSWPNKTKLGDMVAKIAKEHGMQPAVAKSLANVTLPHLDQTEESDVSFLVRVLRQYDAVVKPANGKLVVVKRGESQTSSGEAMQTAKLDATACTSFHLIESAREAPGTVVAYYRDMGQAKKTEVKAGSGEPVKRLRHHYPTQDAAKAAAEGELDKRKRGQDKLSLTMPGDPNVRAEGKLRLTGFGDGIDGEWLVQRVEHDLGTGGFVSHVACEKPKTSDDSE